MTVRTADQTKILQGTFRSDRAAKKTSTLQAALPPAPDCLNATGRKEWARVSKLMVGNGMATRLDRGALTCYCLAWQTLLEATERVEKEGSIVEGKSGRSFISPWKQLETQAMADLLKWARELGLTPASRDRVAIVTREDDKSGWGDF